MDRSAMVEFGVRDVWGVYELKTFKAVSSIDTLATEHPPLRAIRDNVWPYRLHVLPPIQCIALMPPGNDSPLQAWLHSAALHDEVLSVGPLRLSSDDGEEESG